VQFSWLQLQLHSVEISSTREEKMRSDKRR
jgi:hypothetical protein